MKIWIFLDGRQQGPFEMEELLDMPVDENTKVWFEGLPKWYPAGYLDEMKPLLDGSLAARVHARAEENIGGGEDAGVGMAQEPGQESAAEESAAEESAAETPLEPAANRYEEHPVNRLPDAPCPPTYLGWTIFLVICCCSPVSIASLVLSIMTSGAYNSGNLPKARKLSQATAWLIMISFALGFMSFFLWDIFF